MKYTPLTDSNIHFSGFKTKIWWKLAVERLGRAEYKLAAWELCQESHTIFIGELQEEEKQKKINLFMVSMFKRMILKIKRSWDEMKLTRLAVSSVFPKAEKLTAAWACGGNYQLGHVCHRMTAFTVGLVRCHSHHHYHHRKKHNMLSICVTKYPHSQLN